MVIYTAEKGVYINYETSRQQNPTKLMNMYINLTNKCSCSCTFCLRNTKEQREGNTLWLKNEPTADEVIAMLDKQDWSLVNEFVFCGFGEPTMVLDTLLVVAGHIKSVDKNKPIRLNTNGLGRLVHKRSIAPLFKDLIDTISISLNAPDAEEYLELTRNSFGLESYQAMLDFAVECKEYVPKVVLSVVDCIGEAKVEKCRKICEGIGIPLRVRPFE